MFLNGCCAKKKLSILFDYHFFILSSDLQQIFRQVLIKYIMVKDTGEEWGWPGYTGLF